MATKHFPKGLDGRMRDQSGEILQKRSDTKVETKLAFVRDRYIDTAIGKNIFPSVTGVQQADNPIAIVCDYFLRKATKTLDAICILCETGFPEDALVLGRTIFEFGLHLQAIAAPCCVEQQRHRAQCFIYDGDRQRVAKLGELGDLKRLGKCVSWVDEITAGNPVPNTVVMPQNFVSPRNLKEMATEVGGEWECWYAFLYWSVSKLVHPSGLGSHTYLEAVDQEAEVSTALSIAVTMHYHLTICALSLLGLNSLQAGLDESMKEFISPADAC